MSIFFVFKYIIPLIKKNLSCDYMYTVNRVVCIRIHIYVYIFFSSNVQIIIFVLSWNTTEIMTLLSSAQKKRNESYFSYTHTYMFTYVRNYKCKSLHLYT